jgi:hypothetical protein
VPDGDQKRTGIAQHLEEEMTRQCYVPCRIGLTSRWSGSGPLRGPDRSTAALGHCNRDAVADVRGSLRDRSRCAPADVRTAEVHSRLRAAPGRCICGAVAE